MRQLIRPFLLCPIVAALLLLACSSPQERRELQRLLAEADSMNRNYVGFTTDSVLLRAVSLADRHGSNRDRVRARYLLGCAYRDMGEAPQALDCYHQAIDIADTTSTDSSYLVQIAKIHGQAGDLFYRQSMYSLSIQEYHSGERIALRAHDSLTAALIYAQTANCYYDAYKFDSVLTVSRRSRERLMQLGDTLGANTFLGQEIAVLLDRGEYEKVKPLLHLYAHKSRVADTALSVPNYKMLASYCGDYQLGIGNNVEASRYYYKLTRDDSPEFVNRGYYGLYRLYERLGVRDSIVKYGDAYIFLSDSTARTWERERLTAIQSLYTYQRISKQAEVQAAKVQSLRTWLAVVIAFLVIVIVLSFTQLWLYKRYKRIKWSTLLSDYVVAVMHYTRLKSQQISSSANDAELSAKLAQAGRELAELQPDKKDPEEWGLSDEILLSPIVDTLHQLASKSRAATDEQLAELHHLSKEQMPRFLEALAPLRLREDTKMFDVCLLLRLRFSLSEICCLLDVSTQSLNTMRCRLYRKLHGTNGKARDFDEEIQQMPC